MLWIVPPTPTSTHDPCVAPTQPPHFHPPLPTLTPWYLSCSALSAAGVGSADGVGLAPMLAGRLAPMYLGFGDADADGDVVCGAWRSSSWFTKPPRPCTPLRSPSFGTPAWPAPAWSRCPLAAPSSTWFSQGSTYMAFVNPSSRWSGCRCAACFDCPMPRLLPGSLKEGWGGGC